MFWLRNKKNIVLLRTLIWGPGVIAMILSQPGRKYFLRAILDNQLLLGSKVLIFIIAAARR